MKRILIVIGLVAGLTLFTGCESDSPTFYAPFNDSASLERNFDFGYSGQNPFTFKDPGNLGILHLHGDHDDMCEGPYTQRDVDFAGSSDHLDFRNLFWWCAPDGTSASGHLMTGVNTVGYNIAWFSPKQTFTNISKVCWDMNETRMSRRKWTQVIFLDEADAVRYPVTPDESQAPTAPNLAPRPYRGTGGYDLGFVSPEFSDQAGPTTNVISGGTDGQHQTLRGFKESDGMTPEWFQDGAFTTPNGGAAGGVKVDAGTDKATRYQHCLENVNQGTVRLTEDSPAGQRIYNMPGQIMQGNVRVVFEDDNYNPPKDAPPENPDGTYNPDTLTWHWDNITVSAES